MWYRLRRVARHLLSGLLILVLPLQGQAALVALVDCAAGPGHGAIVAGGSGPAVVTAGTSRSSMTSMTSLPPADALPGKGREVAALDHPHGAAASAHHHAAPARTQHQAVSVATVGTDLPATSAADAPPRAHDATCAHCLACSGAAMLIPASLTPPVMAALQGTAVPASAGLPDPCPARFERPPRPFLS